MYVAIDRKPENGCEIQNSACGVSGVMLCLKLVKTKALEIEECEDREDREEGELNHGTKVMIDLVTPWLYSDQIVCADSYFASKQSADEFKILGMRFVGVVKTATRKFPMKYLQSIELETVGTIQEW